MNWNLFEHGQVVWCGFASEEWTLACGSEDLDFNPFVRPCQLIPEKRWGWRERWWVSWQLEIRLKWIPAVAPGGPELGLPSVPLCATAWGRRQKLDQHTNFITSTASPRGARRGPLAAIPWDSLSTEAPFCLSPGGWMKLSSQVMHKRSEPKLPFEI